MKFKIETEKIGNKTTRGCICACVGGIGSGAGTDDN